MCLCYLACRTDSARVTEFKFKDQLSASTSANLEKKKGGQKRRTKREILNATPTALGNAVSHGAHVEIIPPPQESQAAPKKRWPCLVRSPIYNPDYPTFCECLQPHCSYHCPTARSILSRGCTTYSWPAPEVIRNSGWSPPAESYTNSYIGVETGRQGGLIEDPDACKCVSFPDVSFLNQKLQLPSIGLASKPKITLLQSRLPCYFHVSP